MRMTRSRVWFGVAAAAVLAAGLGVAVKHVAASPSKDRAVEARALVQSCVDGVDVQGFAVLREKPSEEGVKQVEVTLVVAGLPDGKHAVHIHEKGLCEAATVCMSAGGHFDPGPNGNSMVDANHPFHTGDLINIEFKNGRGMLRTTTSRLTLSPGPLGIFDADGAAIMIHDLQDTYCPDGNVARCAGGTRAACGVLQPVD
jgi:superoxide dismutase, Cu-Zn family